MKKKTQALKDLIRDKKFSWIKVKQYRMDPDKNWGDRYEDLYNHHVEETDYLIRIIQQLSDFHAWCDNENLPHFCGHIEMMHGEGGCAECECDGFRASK